MALSNPELRKRLARFLVERIGAASVEIEEMRPLLGGAVQENWLVVAIIDTVRLVNRQRLVLRTGAVTGLEFSLGTAREFSLLCAVHAAGIAVPEPLFFCGDEGVIGKPFFLMRWMPGMAAGERIVFGGTGASLDALAERLGGELATLHRIRPPRDELAFLDKPPADPAQARIHTYGRFLETHPEPHPVAEWGLRWLRRHAPSPADVVLCHGDFRTGNYLADEQGLAAILDWEFAGWSDPYEDIGWFFLRCWRFGAYGREAGGLAARAVFYHGYQAASGHHIDPERARYWEVMAALRWLVIALQQRDRFLMGGERSLDLALTGRRPAECEFEILRLTEQVGKAA